MAPTFIRSSKIGATGEIGRVRLDGKRTTASADGRGPDIVESIHAAFLRLRSAIIFCASSTASVIPLIGAAAADIAAHPEFADFVG